MADAARREPAGAAAHPALLAHLARRRRWLAGSAFGGLGWPLQALALTRAPLTVVQPALAVGLVLPLALGTRMLGERVRRRDVLSVGVLAAGVSLVVVAAPPRTAAEVGAVKLAAAHGALCLLVLGTFALTPPSACEPSGSRRR